MKIVRAVTVSQSVGFYTGLMPSLLASGYEIISVSSPGPELEGLRQQGVRCVEVPMARRISLVRDIKSLAALVRVFRREKPDMVHSMTPKAGLLCMIAAWLCRVPVRVHTFTGLVWPTASGLTRKVLMLTDRITCLCATHIIPEGRGVMADLQAHITHKPMRVLGYGNVKGVDMQRFSRRPEVIARAAQLRTDAFTFLYVGRIVADKGINELVTAFSQICKCRDDIRLVLVGDSENADPVTEETRLMISHSDLPIQLAGKMSGDDLVACYAASDCFVLPSYREGFPNAVLEAGAMGLPSIVTDINGSREIIEDGKNGLIVPSKDAEALRAAMERILTDRAATAEMAANARQMIESRFEQGFVRQCLLDFYEEIIWNAK